MDMYTITHNLVSLSLTTQVEVVQGEIPKELYGAFLRNGPNPCFEKAVKRYHWFDGHAMLVCISYYVFLHGILYTISLTKPLYLSLHDSTLAYTHVQRRRGKIYQSVCTLSSVFN